jgi:hypothetical protein
MIVNAGDEYSNFMEMDAQPNAFGFGATSELNNDNFADHISPRQENVNPSMNLDGDRMNTTNERFRASFKTDIAHALAAFDKEDREDLTVTYRPNIPNDH